MECKPIVCVVNGSGQIKCDGRHVGTDKWTNGQSVCRADDIAKEIASRIKALEYCVQYVSPSYLQLEFANFIVLVIYMYLHIIAPDKRSN